MADPHQDHLKVRIDVVGRASRRWKSARSAAEAERLNQLLSESRAINVRRAVEAILRRELPVMTIDVPAKGVGSHQPFPTASEDNAAVDRSVLVSVDLVTTSTTYSLKQKPNRKIYVPSKVWTFEVLSLTEGGGFGYKQIYVKVRLGNPHSGKSIVLGGWFAGGAAVMDPKKAFSLGSRDPRQLLKSVGKKMAFLTREAMEFADFDDIWGRMGSIELKFGLSTKLSYFVFPNLKTDPDMLIYDSKPFGVGLIGADAYLVLGKLKIIGPNPGDFLEVASVPDLVETPTEHHGADGLLLTFPTGKSRVEDLTKIDRQRLVDFVTNKARNIAALASIYPVAASRLGP